MSAEVYLWVKWFHYLSFISWMAMLFYQPRLYVHHVENLEKKEYCSVILKQERLLYNGIGWIAMFGAILSGVAIIVWGPKNLMAMGYFHVKLLCVVLLVAYHLSLGHFYKQLLNGTCKKSGKFFRYYNELPTLIMFVIIWAMVVKANL